MDAQGEEKGLESRVALFWGCRRKFLIRAGLISVVALIGLLVVISAHRERRVLVISCTNHGNHVRYGMLFRSKDDHSWEIPYVPDTAGYKVFYAATLHAPGGLNCNHGARRRKDGGWQFVNLSPEGWEKLFDVLEKSRGQSGATVHGGGVPQLWCGRPTGTSVRVMVDVYPSQGDGMHFGANRVSEQVMVDRLAWLNTELAAMGKPTVSLNIPDDVDWDRVDVWAKTLPSTIMRRISTEQLAEGEFGDQQLK